MVNNHFRTIKLLILDLCLKYSEVCVLLVASGEKNKSRFKGDLISIKQQSSLTSWMENKCKKFIYASSLFRYHFRKGEVKTFAVTFSLEHFFAIKE